jgi:hypothetical protein
MKRHIDEAEHKKSKRVKKSQPILKLDHPKGKVIVGVDEV